MKKLLLLLSFMFALTSCLDKMEQTETIPEGEGFRKMIVPSNFDWKMSSAVECAFGSESSHVSRVYVSLAGAKEPFASFLVGSGIDPVVLNVPNTEKFLEVQYLKDGVLSAATKIEILGGKIAYTIPTDSDPVLVTSYSAKSTRAAEDLDVIRVPATGGYGTMMFEDLWPSYGDFDMNDFVINYQGKVYHHNKNKTKEIVTKLRIAAIGGSQDYELYVRLNHVKGGEVSSVYVEENNGNAIELPKVENLTEGNPVKDPAVIKITHIKDNKMRPSGGSFMNTSLNYEMPVVDLIEFTLRIELRNSVDVNDVVGHVNFFIAKVDESNPSQLKEIHIGDNQPSQFGAELYETIKNASSTTDQSLGYYRSNDNLVWAINIPAEVAHAYEKEDFLEAYPMFKTWAESGGVLAKDWYSPKNRNNEKVVISK